MIDILVTTFNNEKTIERCLNSILEQTNQDFHLYIFDDGSSDKTISICESYKSKFANMSIYKNKHYGIAAERNFAIKHSVGEYFFFVDGDDALNNNLVEELYNKLSKDCYDVVRYGASRIENDNHINYYKSFNLPVLTGIEFILLCSIQDYRFGPLWLYCYNRKFIKRNKLRFYKNRLHEDFLNNYVLLCAQRIGFIDYVGYNYYKNQGSVTDTGSALYQRNRAEDILFVYDHVTNLISSKLKSKTIRHTILTDLFGFLQSNVKYFEGHLLDEYNKKIRKRKLILDSNRQKEHYICSRAIIIDDEKLYLIERKEGNKHFYVFPGGHLEKNEGIFQCVCREVKEELGFDVVPTKVMYEQIIGQEKQVYILCKKLMGKMHKTDAEEYCLPSKIGHYNPVLLSFYDKNSTEIKPIEIFNQIIHDYKNGFSSNKLKRFKLKY